LVSFSLNFFIHPVPRQLLALIGRKMSVPVKGVEENFADEVTGLVLSRKRGSYALAIWNRTAWQRQLLSNLKSVFFDACAFFPELLLISPGKRSYLLSENEPSLNPCCIDPTVRKLARDGTLYLFVQSMLDLSSSATFLVVLLVLHTENQSLPAEFPGKRTVVTTVHLHRPPI
jgi:hypothetical protein